MERGRRWLNLVRFVSSLKACVVPTAHEPVAVALHPRDAEVVGQKVQRRAGDAFRPELFGPFQR